MNYPVKIYKVLSLPRVGIPNSIYFLYDGPLVKQYISSDQGNFTPVSSTVDGALFSTENKDMNLRAGIPVTQHFSGSGFLRASATQMNTACFGLLAQDTLVNHSGNIKLNGVLNIPDWTLIIGNSTLGLRKKYYLGTTLGTLTDTPPTSPGMICQYVGISVDPNTLNVNLGTPILL